MYIIIINTHSGRHGNLRRYQKIKASCTFEDIPFYMNRPDTSFWNQIRESAEKMAHLIKGIIVIGGDGSMHHTLNHLKDLNLPFGLIPSGSGNDFARAMHIPRSPVKAMDKILCSTQTQNLDLIKIQDKSILSILSAGLDADTALRVEDSNIKKLLNRLFIGKFIYLVTVFQIIRSFKPFDLTITADGYDEMRFQKVWLMAIGNTAYYGGGVPICPDASPSDGQLDIVIVHDVSLTKLLIALPSVFFRKHTFFPFVQSFRSGNLQVHSSQTIRWQGDGEAVEASLSATISCQPESVHFMI